MLLSAVALITATHYLLNFPRHAYMHRHSPSFYSFSGE